MNASAGTCSDYEQYKGICGMDTENRYAPLNSKGRPAKRDGKKACVKGNKPPHNEVRRNDDSKLEWNLLGTNKVVKNVCCYEVSLSNSVSSQA